MSLIQKLRRITPYSVFVRLAHKWKFRYVPDEWYLKWIYRGYLGRKLDLKNPSRYSEKLQWLKIYDHDPRYTTMVNKATAKEWAAGLIGREHIIPLLGEWKHFDEIDFDLLPEQFVLKCTHDSHSIIICKDKKKLDREAAKEQLEKALKKDFYHMEGRQWPYKDVPPRIIAEPYMENAATGDLRDYKFFTFNGEPRVMYIATGRGTANTYGDFFDMDFNHLDLCIDHDCAPVPPEKPALFEEMIAAARKLAAGIPQVRVDFYEVNGQFFFGEMTFFHCGGIITFRPEHWDETLGSWIRLPNE